MAYTPTYTVTLLDLTYVPSETAEFELDLGLLSVGIAQENYETSTLSVTIENDVNDNFGVFNIPFSQEVYETDTLSAGISSEIYELGSFNIDITQEQIALTRTLSAGISIKTYATGTLSVSVDQTVREVTSSISLGITATVFGPTSLSVGILSSIYETSDGLSNSPAGNTIPAGLVNPVNESSFWTARVILKSLDVSANLTGEITVDMEEGVAVVASFSLKPTAGLVDLTTWVRASVQIFYVETDKSGTHISDFLLFTGKVDVPSYDVETRTTTFTCTDELQLAFESKTLEQINEVTGGYWSSNVFDETVDKWSYAQDRMSTIPSFIDYDFNKVLINTPWEAKATPDIEFTEAAILDGSLEVDLGNSRGIVNQVKIELGYRYDTFKQASSAFSWTMGYSIAKAATIYGITPLAYTAVLQAAANDGWVFESSPTFTPWPSSGYSDGSLVLNNDPDIIIGASFKVSKRYNQYVNEKTTYTLSAPKSINSLGVIPETESYELVAEYAPESQEFEDTRQFDGTYESVLNSYFATSVDKDNIPVNPSYLGTVDVDFKYTKFANQYNSVSVGGARVMDLTHLITKNNRAELETTVEVVQNLHKTNILRSHRGNSVTFSCLLEPTIDRTKTLRVNTQAVQAKGKVRQVSHSMAIDSGEAVSTIVLGISRSTALGLVDTETPLDKTQEQPVISDSGPVGALGIRSLGTWFEADGGKPRSGYGMEALISGTSFYVPLPEISQSNLSEISVSLDKEFIVDVPNEELTLNA